MPDIGPRGQKWLKIAHVLFACVYVHNHKMLLFWGTFQALTLVFAVFITVLKPWKKTPERAGRSAAKT